ncbi:unnamed protein product [Prorocentrum cordatum]|uniref:ATP synthase subunit b n=1 Tax=Prorocentrum cordatum TaxID=2364126 RepID=A0ABN9QL74_9DINO|nr:unnamed protein product [Polarella glacialis]
MAPRSAARRPALAACLALGLAAALAARAAGCFLPAHRAPPRPAGAAALSAAVLSGAAAPALANEGAEAPEGFLNFGKVPLGGGFELNLDIPETGIVNIAVLIAGLLYLLGPLLSESMATREKEIQGDIDDAIAKFNEATSRLAEAEKAQAQANEVIAEINASIDKDKAEFEATLKANMESTLARQEAAAKQAIKDMEDGAASRIESYISTTAIERGMKELKALDASKKDKYMEMAIDEL